VVLDDVSICLDGLTAAQARFARDHGAVPMMPAKEGARTVCMYRCDEHRTFRWLVDQAGHAVESAAFRRADC
jgi:hypothetical protein